MKDYTAFITAYQQEIQCLGAIKHVLNLVKAGQPVTHVESLHVNDYCVEVIRQVYASIPRSCIHYIFCLKVSDSAI